MNPASESNSPGISQAAEGEYLLRLESLERLQQAATLRGRVYGVSKLVVAAFTLIAAGFLIHHATGLLILLAPAALFVVLAVLHEKLLESMRYRARAIRFYQDGLARLRDAWRGRGETGERFLEVAHPYARDLDIFGDASLFQYLSTARTRAGEDTLASWLMEAADTGEIGARQDAVRDLRARLEFREKIASAAEPVRDAVDPDALSKWGQAKPVFTSTATRILVAVCAVLWIASIAAWVKWGSPVPAMLITLLNFAYAHKLAARLDAAARGIDKASADLRLLAAVLARFEAERFAAPKLVSLQAALKREGIAPSEAIRRLAPLAELIESRHSLFARPLDLVTFWSAQLVFVAERWQRRFGPQLGEWVAAVGELEALASLASFAFEHPEYAFPKTAQPGPVFSAQCLAHPLLPAGKAVENDLHLDGARQLMILSGPNMAGKSTFIRAIGVNAVLAQCGAPVRALSLTMSPLRVAASICILDSLSGGVSRFYAEIRRVKMIADLAQGSVPVLFLLDELLSGTNSHDRLVGTEYVLREMVERHAIGIVSTHDLALTRIPEAMGGRAFNAHFDDRIEGDALIFEYKLKPGVVQTSNALKLMRAIGLGVVE
jgi:MutS domain V